MGPGTRGSFSRTPRNATRWTGACISWMPLSFAPINTLPARAGPALSGGGGEALGRSQGGFSTKLHLRAEGNGRPITAVLTGGERQEQIARERLLDPCSIRGQSAARDAVGRGCARSRLPATKPIPVRQRAAVAGAVVSPQ